MTKNELLMELRACLWTLPNDEVQSALDYYSEIIDDQIEDGISEQDAVASLGSVKEIASQFLGESNKQTKVNPYGSNTFKSSSSNTNSYNSNSATNGYNINSSTDQQNTNSNKKFGINLGKLGFGKDSS